MGSEDVLARYVSYVIIIIVSAWTIVDIPLDTADTIMIVCRHPFRYCLVGKEHYHYYHRLDARAPTTKPLASLFEFAEAYLAVCHPPLIVLYLAVCHPPLIVYGIVLSFIGNTSPCMW